MNTTTLPHEFSTPLLTWFDQHGRKDLPWQHPRSAYRVWVAEIMLQQTQVKTVIPYFQRFMASFSDVWQLAQAKEDLVLAHWSGLGYYSRARNLHKTAMIICEKYNGIFPAELPLLISLPGIGPSTAAAITSQAYDLPTAILDGNVKRVLTRYFMIDGWSEQSSIKQKLWQLANQCMPKHRCVDYTQAIMDLGATCCTLRKPTCSVCPLQKNCLANCQNKTSLYPHKKPKKTLPVRQQQFLLIYRDSKQIYLEKRPPVGLWGGLWCMPMIDITLCPQEYVKKSYALTSHKQQELLTIKHSFSHFHLHIKALALQTTIDANFIAENSGQWFNIEETKSIGLAKPTNEIIRYFLLHHQ